MDDAPSRPTRAELLGESGGAEDYVIQPGDTLSAIAREHGISLSELLDENPHIDDPDRIRVGDRVRVPGKGDDGGGGSPAANETAGDGTLSPSDSMPELTAAVEQGDASAAIAELASAGDAGVLALRAERNVESFLQLVEGAPLGSADYAHLQTIVDETRQQGFKTQLLDRRPALLLEGEPAADSQETGGGDASDGTLEVGSAMPKLNDAVRDGDVTEALERLARVPSRGAAALHGAGNLEAFAALVGSANLSEDEAASLREIYGATTYGRLKSLLLDACPWLILE